VTVEQVPEPGAALGQTRMTTNVVPEVGADRKYRSIRGKCLGWSGYNWSLFTYHKRFCLQLLHNLTVSKQLSFVWRF